MSGRGPHPRHNAATVIRAGRWPTTAAARRGRDATIEGAAGVVVWRFTGARLHSDRAERRAQRLVAIPVGLWWLDPVAALAIAALAAREGIAAWRGDDCCIADLCADRAGCTRHVPVV